MIRILLVNQTESQLLPGELSALYRAFGNSEIEFHTTNPRNHEEHAGDCKNIRPTAVLMPFTHDDWIPVQAMKNGVRHIVVSAGVVSEVCPKRLDYTRDLKPFVL